MSFDNGTCQKIIGKMKKPYVKHHVCAGVEMYADRDEKKPFAAISVNDEQSYTVWCVLKIIAIIVLVMWSICKVKRIFKKLF